VVGDTFRVHSATDLTFPSVVALVSAAPVTVPLDAVVREVEVGPAGFFAVQFRSHPWSSLLLLGQSRGSRAFSRAILRGLQRRMHLNMHRMYRLHATLRPLPLHVSILRLPTAQTTNFWVQILPHSYGCPFGYYDPLVLQRRTSKSIPLYHLHILPELQPLPT